MPLLRDLLIFKCKKSTLQGWHSHFACKGQHHPSGRKTPFVSSQKGGFLFPLVSMRPCRLKCAHVWWVKDFTQVVLGRCEITVENNLICKTNLAAPHFLSIHHVLTARVWTTGTKDRKDLLTHPILLLPGHSYSLTCIQHYLQALLWKVHTDFHQFFANAQAWPFPS